MSNVNSPTDQYFLGPDYELKGQAIVKAAIGTNDLVSTVKAIAPLSNLPAVYSQPLGNLRVPAQLQKRRFYWSLVFDQVQRWSITGEIIFKLNNSPVLTWPIFFQDVITRNQAQGGTDWTNPANFLLLRPQDAPLPPYWIDVQKCTVNSPLTEAQTQSDNPANENLNFAPLATCPQINAPDSLWYKFPAIAQTGGIAGTNNLVYYTVVMFPTHMDLMCDSIEFNLTKANFVVAEGNATDNQGFVVCHMACNSARY